MKILLKKLFFVLQSTGSFSAWLLKIQEPMIPSWQCDMLYSGVGGVGGITPDQMCAASPDGGQGVCSVSNYLF